MINFETKKPISILCQLTVGQTTTGLPNVLGCIDGTHIAIKSPSQNEDAYVNRKGFHSINVQAVCDNNMKLINLVAKWPFPVTSSLPQSQ
jgi:DDE superfamily endonuclease